MKSFYLKKECLEMQYLQCDLIFPRCGVIFSMQSCSMPWSLVYLVHASFLWVSTCLANLPHTFTLHVSSSSYLDASRGIWLDFFLIQSSGLCSSPGELWFMSTVFFCVFYLPRFFCFFFSRNSLFLAFLDLRNLRDYVFYCSAFIGGLDIFT